jgi:osmoprotectant transport system permease protein
MIELQQLSKTFRTPEGSEVQAVRGLELTVRDGETLCLWALLAARRGKTLVLTLQHLKLTGIAVALAILFAVPLGLAATRLGLLRRLSLGSAGVIQTVPSLALLAFMIPLPGLGLGVRSAVAALFLYAVLPILRNTYTGIVEVDPDLVEAARGMGLRDRQVLLRIQLPLATRTIRGDPGGGAGRGGGPAAGAGGGAAGAAGLALAAGVLVGAAGHADLVGGAGVALAGPAVGRRGAGLEAVLVEDLAGGGGLGEAGLARLAQHRAAVPAAVAA